MKRRLFKISVLLAGLGAVGFLIVASGIISIKASSGHWPITAWFLHFAMQRSVATHSLGVEPPVLTEPRLIMKGAGHYESGCRPCHGSPHRRPPKIVQSMTPPPPYLPPRIATWKPKELFYIVKHGVKFTGMPAWPTQQRDDEVWAVVAFLLAFPKLDSEQYNQLANGAISMSGEASPRPGLPEPKQALREIIANCARCHGVNGGGRGLGAFPKLAGQRPEYLLGALQAFARGKRHSGIMQPIAVELSRETVHELAHYYGNLPASASKPPLQETSTAVKRGEAIAHQGLPGQRVPSCADCHGPSATRRNPAYPVLAGQYADYLVLQLELFKKKHRGGSAYAHLMHAVVSQLTVEQMRDVAQYYESLS